MMFNDEIVVVKPHVVRDRYGSDSLDYGEAAARATVPNVAVQPRSTTENTADARDQVVAGWRIYSRAGTDLDVDPVDHIEWAGRKLEVVGEVARWPHPTRPGAVHHAEVDVQRITG